MRDQAAPTIAIRHSRQGMVVAGLKKSSIHYLEKHHVERTKKSQGRQEETHHDAERKEGCQEVQKGIQEYPGRTLSILVVIRLAMGSA